MSTTQMFGTWPVKKPTEPHFSHGPAVLSDQPPTAERLHDPTPDGAARVRCPTRLRNHRAVFRARVAGAWSVDICMIGPCATRRHISSASSADRIRAGGVNLRNPPQSRISSSRRYKYSGQVSNHSGAPWRCKRSTAAGSLTCAAMARTPVIRASKPRVLSAVNSASRVRHSAITAGSIRPASRSARSFSPVMDSSSQCTRHNALMAASSRNSASNRAGSWPGTPCVVHVPVDHSWENVEPSCINSLPGGVVFIADRGDTFAFDIHVGAPSPTRANYGGARDHKVEHARCPPSVCRRTPSTAGHRSVRCAEITL
jgi:hypothetical protein